MWSCIIRICSCVKPDILFRICSGFTVSITLYLCGVFTCLFSIYFQVAYLKSKENESEIQSMAVSDFESGIDFSLLGERDEVAEDSVRRQPQSLSFAKPQSEDTARNALRAQSPSRIPISPRLKQPSTPIQKDDPGTAKSEKTANEDVSRKVKEQAEDIKTLLQSVEYFEKEAESLKQKAKDTDNMREKMRKLETDLKSLKTRNARLQDQLKDSKIYDEKLKSLEDKMKKLTAENKLLEQQTKKSKKKQSADAKEAANEAAKEAAKEREEFQRDAMEIESLKQISESKEMVLRVFMNQLDIDELPFDNLKEYVSGKIEEKVVDRQGGFADRYTTAVVPDIVVTEDTRDLRETQEELEDELVKKMSEVGWKNDQIEELKTGLYAALADRSNIEAHLADAKLSLRSLGGEMEELKARNIVLEVMLRAVENLGSRVVEDGGRAEETDERRRVVGETEEEGRISELDRHKASSVVLEVMRDVMEDLGNQMRDPGNDGSAAMEELRARNIALEVIQDVLKELCLKVLDAARPTEEVLSRHLASHHSELKQVWDELKRNLGQLKLIDESEFAEDVYGLTGKARRDTDLSDLEAVISEMEAVCSELGKKSHTVWSTEAVLEEQIAVNLGLERRLEEFKQIVDDTSSKINKMENEKESNDEIGHRLMLDQVSSLKEKMKKLEEDKMHLRDEVDRRQKNVTRLSEQVRLMEGQVSSRQSEVAELTQRALEGEEELDVVRNRNEELEDDYQRLLQYGMQPDGRGGKGRIDEEKQEDVELLMKMEEKIQSLEEEKVELEKRIEEFMKKDRQENAEEDKQEELELIMKMEEKIQSLEAEKVELEKRIEDFMKKDGQEKAEEDKQEELELLMKMEEKIEKLEGEKAELERENEQRRRAEVELHETTKELRRTDDELRKKLEDATFANLVQLDTREVGSDDDKEQAQHEIALLHEALHRLQSDKAELEKTVAEFVIERAAKEGSDGVTRADREEELRIMKETFYKLEGEKTELEDRIAELEDGAAKKEEEQHALQLKNEAQVESMADSIYRLELDKIDLEGRVDELNLEASRQSSAKVSKESGEEITGTKRNEIANMEDRIYGLELDKRELERRVEELNSDLHMKDDSKLDSLKMAKDGYEEGDRDEQIQSMEETIYRLEMDKSELEQRVAYLVSEEQRELVALKEHLILSEEKMADLEHELKIVSSDKETMQSRMDGLLVSPRSGSSDEEEYIPERDQDIFRGGPMAWKRRLVASYRELREKSVEVSSLRMIIEAKNAEIDSYAASLDAQSAGNEAKYAESEGGNVVITPVSFSRTGDQISIQSFPLREKAHMLQEEVKLKSKEIGDLREEITQLRNELDTVGGKDVETVSESADGKSKDGLANEALRREVENLKIELKQKEENYEVLCDQLFGGGTASSTAEIAQLKNDITDLKQRLETEVKMTNELEGNNELLYNELIKIKAGVNEAGVRPNEAGFSANEASEHVIKEQEERYAALSGDYDELETKYREEMNYASTHIGELMMQVENLEGQLQSVQKQVLEAQSQKEAETSIVDHQVLQGRLHRVEDELQRKNGLVANLKETVASFYDQADEVSGEFL